MRRERAVYTGSHRREQETGLSALDAGAWDSTSGLGTEQESVQGPSQQRLVLSTQQTLLFFG